MTRVLFVCGKNQWRSPTAEQVFSSEPGLECASAGVSNDAEIAVSGELVDWADLIFVMERQHKEKLARRFGENLKGKRLVCLGIPDNYRFMDPKLIELLRRKFGHICRASRG